MLPIKRYNFSTCLTVDFIILIFITILVLFFSLKDNFKEEFDKVLNIEALSYIDISDVVFEVEKSHAIFKYKLKEFYYDKYKGWI